MLLLYLLVLCLMEDEVLDQTLCTEGTKPYSLPTLFSPPSRVYTDTVISGRLPAGNVLIFLQTVAGAGYRKVRVM